MRNLKSVQLRYKSLLSFNQRFYISWGAITAGYIYASYLARNSNSEIFRLGVAGSLSVVAVELIYYPLDWINNKSKISSINKGTFRAAQSIIRKEGIASLFKGFTITYYGAIVYGFAYFLIYKYLKQVNHDWFEKRNKLELMYFLAAGFADWLALLLYFPFEVVKLRMQWCHDLFQYRGLIDGFKNLYKSYGIFGCYKGYTPYVLNFVFNYSIQFTLYETIISYIKNNLGRDYYYKNDHFIVILTSMLWGFIGSGLTNWFEVLAVRKQADVNEPTIQAIRELRLKMFTSGIKVRMFYHTFQSVFLFYSLHLFGKLYSVELNDD